MSLLGFQQALADLVGSPELVRAARADPAAVLGRYELTPLEERRLAAAVRQRGMATSCALYRANRLAPLYTLLPLTCFLLGPRLRQELERFWAVQTRPGDAADRELYGFAGLLRERLATGELEDPFLGEVLAYELANYELGLLPGEGPAPLPPGGARGPRLVPGVRVVPFRHDPTALLRLLAARSPPPYAVAEGEFYLLLDARGEAREVTRISARAGRLLLSLGSGEAGRPAAGELDALVAAGLVVAS